MVSDKAINDIMESPWKEVRFFSNLVTDDGLYDQKSFYKVKIVFIHPL